jgi:hypothetical protein
MALRNSIRHQFLKLKDFTSTLNVFPSVPPSTDEYELQTQRTSTRLFIIIFSMSLTILLLYTSLIKATKIGNVKEPTFTDYSQLYSIHSEALTCPCSNISINYDNFLHVNYTLHQVCSSIFVDQVWIKYLSNASETEFLPENFRWTGPYAFQALRAFCDLSNQTISNRLIQFYSNQYVSASVVPQTLFESETQSLIDQFRSSSTNNFLLSLATIRDTTQANALFSALQNNYRIDIKLAETEININPILYNGCRCSASSTCIFPSFVDFSRPSSVLFDMPNFYRGCNVIESLLQSTLECFYNQQCIDGLQRQISSSPSVSVTALDKSLPSVYFMDSTIGELLNNLMIEQWNVSPIFENYYNACHPIKCTYTLEMNNNLIYIITTLFGIAGGLITVLQFVVPQLVKLVRKKTQQQQQAIIGKIKLRMVIRVKIDDQFHRF